MLFSDGGAFDGAELGPEDEDTFATLLRNHSGPNLIDSVIVSSKIKRRMHLIIARLRS